MRDRVKDGYPRCTRELSQLQLRGLRIIISFVVNPNDNRPYLIVSVEPNDLRGEAPLNRFYEFPEIKIKRAKIRDGLGMRGRVLTPIRRNEVGVGHHRFVRRVTNTHHRVETKPLKVGVDIIWNGDFRWVVREVREDEP